MKEEWRSAMTTSGGQSVMIPGLLLMRELSADNLDTHPLVGNRIAKYANESSLQSEQLKSLCKKIARFK